ncbi:MAG: ABC transporter permease [Nocardia sp.]|nr:ABC transporter permease [Nocardia sp.]
MTTLDARTSLSAGRFPGGFRFGFLRMELIRLLRNRRTLLVTLIMPPVFFAIFGLQSDFREQSFGSGNMTGYVMVSLAVYGAMVATTSGGAMVAIERAQGWSRQLRLTPLRPISYIATKAVGAMVLGLLSVAVVFAVGAVVGARLTVTAWVFCFLLAWASSLVFAAFGLFIGYLLPSENVMQLLGPALAALSFGGGLFIPLHGWFGSVSAVLPTNGVATLVRMPFGATSGSSIILAVVNITLWTFVFVGGAALMFRRDTAR